MQVSDFLYLAMGCGIVALVGYHIMRQWLIKPTYTHLEGDQTKAKEWLEKNGYEITRVKECAEWTLYLDTQSIREKLMVDFIVRKHGKYYAVIVQDKINYVSLPSDAQLNWYSIFTLYSVSGILQLDLHEETIHSIDFDLRQPKLVTIRKIFNRFTWFFAGIACAFMWIHKA